jgi:hypothetical protein
MKIEHFKTMKVDFIQVLKTIEGSLRTFSAGENALTEFYIQKVLEGPLMTNGMNYRYEKAVGIQFLAPH